MLARLAKGFLCFGNLSDPVPEIISNDIPLFHSYFRVFFNSFFFTFEKLNMAIFRPFELFELSSFRYRDLQISVNSSVSLFFAFKLSGSNPMHQIFFNIIFWKFNRFCWKKKFWVVSNFKNMLKNKKIFFSNIVLKWIYLISSLLKY